MYQEVETPNQNNHIFKNAYKQFLNNKNKIYKNYQNMYQIQRENKNN